MSIGDRIRQARRAWAIKVINDDCAYEEENANCQHEDNYDRPCEEERCPIRHEMQ